MLIRSVHLENIKSYEDETIELPSGLVAVSGENGAGKSTILEVVGFALFGFLAGTQAALLREGAGSGGFEVVFQSRLDGRDYAVVRKFRRNRNDDTVATSSLEIRDAERGGAIVEKTEETERFLRRHLGLEGTNVDPESVFANVVGVPQGRLIADFLERPSDRKAKFDPLLGTQDFRDAFDELLAPLNHLQARISQLREKRAGLEVHVADLPVVQAAIEKTSAGLIEVESETRQVAVAVESGAVRVAALERGEKALERARATARAATDGVKAAEDRCRLIGIEEQKAAAAKKQAEQLLADFNAFALTEKDLATLRDQHDELRAAGNELASRRTELSGIERRARHTRTSLDALTAIEAELSGLNAAVTKLETIEAKLQATNQALTQAEDRAAALPGLRATLQDLQSRLQSQEDLNRQARSGAELAQRADELQAVTASIEAQLGHLETDASAAATLSREIEGLNRAIPGERAHLETLVAGADASAVPVDGLAAATELAIARGDRLVELLSSRLSSVDPSHHTRLEVELEQLQQELAHARKAQKLLLGLEAGETNVADLQKRISAIETDIATAGEAEKTVLESRDEERTLHQAIADLGEPNPRDRRTRALVRLEEKPRLANSLADEETAAAKTRGLVDALALATEPLPRLTEQVANLTAQLAGLQPRRDDFLAAEAVAGGLPDLQSRLAAATEESTTARADLESAQQTLAAAEADFDSTELANSREQARKLQGEWGALGTRREHLESTKRELEARLGNLRRHEAELARTNESVERNVHLHRILGLLRNSLRDAGPEVTRTLLSSIAATANEVYGEIMGDYTQLLKLDAEYGISLDTLGHERVFSQLSGGEQIIAAMAVRLAMLRELLRIDMAFLDEPTQNLDQTRRDNLAEQIRRIRGFSQIVVVSHDDTFERLLQSVIHVEKTDGVSRVIS